MEIIIDGVDVAECLAYKNKHCIDKTSIMFCETNLCNNYPNCYYKQLKRLEEKLEKIEEVITEFSKEDIITLPDLTAKDNYNLIAKQYAEPITKIIKIIRGEE